MDKIHLTLAAATMAAGSVLVGCYTHDGSMKSINRDALMRDVKGCNEGNAFSCKTLGDSLLGVTAQSRQSDWHQGHDRPGAKRAYRRGCLLGWGAACAAIVEYKLFDDEQERLRYVLRTTFSIGQVRTPEELAAERAKIDAEVAERNREIAATRRAEEASNANSWAAFGQAVQQSAPQIQETATRLASGGRTPSAGRTAGAGGAGGTAMPKDCGCANISTAVCTQKDMALSRECYLAQARVNDCLARPGCSSNTAQAAAEATRLRKAAAEVSR